MSIVLDAVFDCLAIVKIFTPDHFTFRYHEKIEGDTTFVYVVGWGIIDGHFDATRVSDQLWDARRSPSE